MVFSGDRTPQASGQTGRGLGSQQRSLVRRGQRSTMAVRRDDPSWLVGDSPSGAEASSGPPNTCRSTGRGVEKATEIPPSGTPGNCGRPHSYTTKFYSAGRLRRPSVKFRSKALLLPFRDAPRHSTSVVGPLAHPTGSLAVVAGNRLPFPGSHCSHCRSSRAPGQSLRNPTFESDRRRQNRNYYYRCSKLDF